jgi:hypothetical protein
MKTKNIKVLGKPAFVLTLKDIPPIGTFYVTPWSYDPITEELDLDAKVYLTSGGTGMLPVKKLLDGKYQIDLRNLGYEYNR